MPFLQALKIMVSRYFFGRLLHFSRLFDLKYLDTNPCDRHRVFAGLFF